MQQPVAVKEIYFGMQLWGAILLARQSSFTWHVQSVTKILSCSVETVKLGGLVTSQARNRSGKRNLNDKRHCLGNVLNWFYLFIYLGKGCGTCNKNPQPGHGCCGYVALLLVHIKLLAGKSIFRQITNQHRHVILVSLTSDQVAKLDLYESSNFMNQWHTVFNSNDRSNTNLIQGFGVC